ncbi:hypothetical protein NEOLEDRAFT_1132257 [Neolentinus lepideus HHB14362 ss-1]|uniref:Anaphase-promoting complex subunit 5 n=1 Tax=Neolentinus lepideus HHB14362 ss-1 TaxID=1314782 RepID=A0A165T706_9AGAM|nr:hypothetical protein NEOLEDRAFT_1132257 [Neolentinus lepideus HHB14362 ss-1]
MDGSPSDQDGPPPPTPIIHILRPHHIGILSILMLTFKEEFETRALSAPFLLHVYRILLYEISEVAEPKPWHQLIREISSGPTGDIGGARYDAQYLIEALKDVHIDLRNADELTLFLQGVPMLFSERDDEPAVFTRRSPFGFFCRRCYITFLKLSIVGVVRLQRDYQAWRHGDSKAGYGDKPLDRLNNDSFLFRTKHDLEQYATPDAYAAFEKARDVADVSEAVECLRRYFEQCFHYQRDSKYRQHTLIQLVRFYYQRREFAAAKDLLDEAIETARRANDKVSVEYCKTLKARMPNKEPGRRPALNPIEPNVHPYEVLFDVKKLMQVEFEQPLIASFERIVEVIGVFDQWAEQENTSQSDAEQWGQHAVQSLVWKAAGCTRLGDIEENIVIAFTEVASDDNNRITVLLNRAYKEARQGKYVEALCMLLEPDVWRGLAMSDYELWANEVWHILVLRATRRGQVRLFREYLRPKRPMGVYRSRDYFLELRGSHSSKIRDPLHEVIYSLNCGQGTSSVEPLLTSLWDSEFQCRFGSYRTGVTLLADVCMEFGMTKRPKRILQDIMPQIINGDDLEQRALACFTMARCLIAAGDADNPGLEEAVEYLDMAEADYATLEMYVALAKVQYLLAVVYNSMGREDARNAAAERHRDTSEILLVNGGDALDNEVHEIWTLVTDVGAALSMR